VGRPAGSQLRGADGDTRDGLKGQAHWMDRAVCYFRSMACTSMMWHVTFGVSA